MLVEIKENFELREILDWINLWLPQGGDFALLDDKANAVFDLIVSVSEVQEGEKHFSITPRSDRGIQGGFDFILSNNQYLGSNYQPLTESTLMKTIADATREEYQKLGAVLIVSNRVFYSNGKAFKHAAWYENKNLKFV